jgi:hypothetical protein
MGTFLWNGSVQREEKGRSKTCTPVQPLQQDHCQVGFFSVAPTSARSANTEPLARLNLEEDVSSPSNSPSKRQRTSTITDSRAPCLNQRQTIISVQAQQPESLRILHKLLLKHSIKPSFDFIKNWFYHFHIRRLQSEMTKWSHAAAPYRRATYGKYTNKCPSETPTGLCPPWWPKDVKYSRLQSLKRNGKYCAIACFARLHI